MKTIKFEINKYNSGNYEIKCERKRNGEMVCTFSPKLRNLIQVERWIGARIVDNNLEI